MAAAAASSAYNAWRTLRPTPTVTTAAAGRHYRGARAYTHNRYYAISVIERLNRAAVGNTARENDRSLTIPRSYEQW